MSSLSHVDNLFWVYFPPLLQDPNQLIRASALRVLSSIRVPIIVPIMMLAIKEAAADLSPYVRKTSAHAIQKLYRFGSVCVPFAHRKPAGQWASSTEDNKAAFSSGASSA